MTKRPNPFDSGVLRQFKIHINNAEYDKDIKEDIQKKTMEKLFAAQKSNWNNNFNACLPSQNVINLKQKHVSNSFRSNHNNIKTKAVLNYNIGNGEICSYCDIWTDNIYMCSTCSEVFCHNCSLADYGSNEDKRICLSCS